MRDSASCPCSWAASTFFSTVCHSRHNDVTTSLASYWDASSLSPLEM